MGVLGAPNQLQQDESTFLGGAVGRTACSQLCVPMSVGFELQAG